MSPWLTTCFSTAPYTSLYTRTKVSFRTGLAGRHVVLSRSNTLSWRPSIFHVALGMTEWLHSSWMPLNSRPSFAPPLTARSRSEETLGKDICRRPRASSARAMRSKPAVSSVTLLRSGERVALICGKTWPKVIQLTRCDIIWSM